MNVKLSPLAVLVLMLAGWISCQQVIVIELAKRVVHVAGVTTHPGEAWMLQIDRSLTDLDHSALNGKSRLIIDRDASVKASASR